MKTTFNFACLFCSISDLGPLVSLAPGALPSVNSHVFIVNVRERADTFEMDIRLETEFW